jgi:predicted phage terminase large subunit-like protein
MKPATYEQFDAVTRVHLAVFLRRVFAEINPGTEFLDNWHVHVLIDELEALRFGRARRLAVAMPPRSLKSLLISVAYVAWLLGYDRKLRLICVSYGQELADKLASDCRQVMQTDWYQRSFPCTRLRQRRQALGNFETTAGGGRFSTSVGGVITGFGADYIIVDDPSKPSETLSDAERGTINQWIQHTLLTRLNDKLNGRILIVMQRLHVDDVIGNVVEKTGGQFELLAFAAIAQTDEVHSYRGAFGVVRVARSEGDALHAAREPLHVLEEQRVLLGSAFFSAQYLQMPVPLEGNLVKRSSFGTYQAFEILRPDRIIQSWDTAAKIGDLNDYSVCTTWAIIGNRYYLLDVLRERLEFPALKKRVITQSDRFKPDLVLIEDKGSGTGLLQELRVSGFGKGRAFMPKGDKAMRLATATPIFEEGRVLLPASAPWRDSYVDELCGFPGLTHDDQVDSTSQFLAWARDEGDPGGLWHFTREEAERARAFVEDRTVQFRAPSGVSHFYAVDGSQHIVDVYGTIWLTEEHAKGARMGGWAQLSD